MATQHLVSLHPVHHVEVAHFVLRRGPDPRNPVPVADHGTPGGHSVALGQCHVTLNNWVEHLEHSAIAVTAASQAIVGTIRNLW